MKKVMIKRERKSENWSTCDYFMVIDDVNDIEKAFRLAILEYMQLKEAEQIILDFCGDFNWGDALSHISEKVLANHGIFPCNDDVIEIVVNQDEILYSEIQEKISESKDMEDGYIYKCLKCEHPINDVDSYCSDCYEEIHKDDHSDINN